MSKLNDVGNAVLAFGRAVLTIFVMLILGKFHKIDITFSWGCG
jgi:hypothetical protein